MKKSRYEVKKSKIKKQYVFCTAVKHAAKRHGPQGKNYLKKRKTPFRKRDDMKKSRYDVKKLENEKQSGFV